MESYKKTTTSVKQKKKQKQKNKTTTTTTKQSLYFGNTTVIFSLLGHTTDRILKIMNRVERK